MELGAAIILLSSFLIGANTYTTPGAACGGYYTASSGVFASPGYPGTYPNYADCSWRISSGGGMNIRLTFTSVDVEAHSQCRYDGIRVYDGPSSSSPLIETLCGSTTKTFFSEGSDLTVVFYSDSDNVHQGFVARWVFEDPTAWTTDDDYILDVSTVVDDTTVDSDWTTEIQTTDPNEVTTTDPIAWTTDDDYITDVSTVVDDTTVDSDWTTEIQTTEPTAVTTSGVACGDYYTASSGAFASPGYPGNYPNHARCTWHISSEGGMNIRLTFPFVDVEAHSQCSYDGIRVYDGPSTSSPLIETFCGSTTKTFFSEGSDLTVVFYSDSMIVGQGFVARWVFEDFNTAPPSWITEDDYIPDVSTVIDNTTEVSVRTTETQSTEPTVKTSTQESPSCNWNCGYNFSSCSCDSSCQYNGNCCYDYYDYCHTKTTPTPEPSCRWNCGANFSRCSCNSSCQSNGNCCHDYYDYCLNTTASPTTESPSCRWNCGYNFSSCSCDSSCQYYGNCCHDYRWYCSSTTQRPPVTAPNCGGSLFGSGFLSSPNYPNYYHDNAYCVWRLSALPGEKIFLSFVDLELQDCCGCDYVNVYDGSTTVSPLLGNLCFNSGLQDFHSSSSYLTVLFRSDYSVVARGFKASYSSSLPSNTARVTCSSDHMIIEIRRSYLESLGISWHNLYVDDHRCRPSANSYEVSFNFPVGQCGTNKKFYNGRVVYNNHVRAAPSQSGEITRTIDEFLLNVTCHMEQDTTAGTVYKAKESVNSTITGTGRFNATMSFFPSPSFSYPILEYPYEVKLNQNLYVQVQLTRADNTLDVFLETCVASPNHNFDARVYPLLQNGCRQDNTVQIYNNGQHYYAQFSFKAFKFLRTHAFVFLQCRVLVCADNDYGSRCRRGCINRTKRSLDSAHHTEVVTLGPITLKGARSAAKVDVGK